MKTIELGFDARGEKLQLDSKARSTTHMHVIGGSGTGKSKFLEWLIRQDLRAGNGLCLIDWHGTLYTDVLRYCAHLDIGLQNDFRSLTLLNPSEPQQVSGFNPFMNQGQDISAQVSRRIDATVRPWGVSNTDQMPTFERLTRILYTFAIEAGETLPNAAKLLEFDQRQLREFAIRTVRDEYVKGQWRQLQSIKLIREWRDTVLSTENRLARFLGSTAVKRFMGLPEGNIDLLDIMDQGKILLVNLGASDFLDRESARVFASLLLNEFFETAMRRASRSRMGEKPPHFVLYLDEFQEYITDDIASMLDQVRKGGLHLVLAHQHLAHLEEHPKLKDSVFTNARIRAVFGGLPYRSAAELANEMFLPDLNTRQIKKAYYHTIHLYQEQTRFHRSKGSSVGASLTHGESKGTTEGTAKTTSAATAIGSTISAGCHAGLTTAIPTDISGVPALEGWFESTSEGTTAAESATRTEISGESSTSSLSRSKGQSRTMGQSVSESEGSTEVPVFVPIPQQELGSEAEWSREEKVSHVAQTLKEQMQRHCFIKINTEKTQPMLVPLVREHPINEELLTAYEGQVYSGQGALSAPEVDARIETNAQRFLEAAKTPTDITVEPAQPEPARRGRKKKPKPDNPFERLLEDDGPIGRW